MYYSHGGILHCAPMVASINCAFTCFGRLVGYSDTARFTSSCRSLNASRLLRTDCKCLLETARNDKGGCGIGQDAKASLLFSVHANPPGGFPTRLRPRGLRAEHFG